MISILASGRLYSNITAFHYYCFISPPNSFPTLLPHHQLPVWLLLEADQKRIFYACDSVYSIFKWVLYIVLFNSSAALASKTSHNAASSPPSKSTSKVALAMRKLSQFGSPMNSPSMNSPIKKQSKSSLLTCSKIWSRCREKMKRRNKRYALSKH